MYISPSKQIIVNFRLFVNSFLTLPMSKDRGFLRSSTKVSRFLFLKGLPTTLLLSYRAYISMAKVRDFTLEPDK